MLEVFEIVLPIIINQTICSQLLLRRVIGPLGLGVFVQSL